VEYELLDGESLAVDWHYIVIEELLNHIQRPHKHPSIDKEKSKTALTKIPLEKCLDKFNESEVLEGIVCPRCHEENTLRKSFMLWRLPPVLIIQLKRFQFDRTSRKKLNNRIDFPVKDLDLSNYIAPSKLDGSKSSEMGFEKEVSQSVISSQEKNSSDSSGDEMKENTPPVGAGGVSSDLANSDYLCANYDLYCVIHHIGALGGGHYVTTVRLPVDSFPSPTNGASFSSQLLKSFRSLTSSSNEPTTDSTHYSNKKEPKIYKWFTFNDNIVNEIDEQEIISPSAYVLFYMRKDIVLRADDDINPFDVNELLKSELMLSEEEFLSMTSPMRENYQSKDRGHLNHKKPPNSELSDSKEKVVSPGESSSPHANNVEESEVSSSNARNQYILAKKMTLPKRIAKGGERNDFNKDKHSAVSPTPAQTVPSVGVTAQSTTGDETSDSNCVLN
jgi:hypothetical protein